MGPLECSTATTKQRSPLLWDRLATPREGPIHKTLRQRGGGGRRGDSHSCTPKPGTVGICTSRRIPPNQK
eukprot:6666721-Pyramimonas_sp.AAC.1